MRYDFHEFLAISNNQFCNGAVMSSRSQDVFPLSEERLVGLPDKLVSGPAMSQTESGAKCVTIGDAKKTIPTHAVDEEHAGLILLWEAETALREIFNGQRVRHDDLMKSLACI